MKPLRDPTDLWYLSNLPTDTSTFPLEIVKKNEEPSFQNPL